MLLYLQYIASFLQFLVAEQEARLAAQRFEESTKSITDTRTIKTLLLLSRNYKQRADQVRTLLGEKDVPIESKQSTESPFKLSHNDDENKTSTDFEDQSAKIAHYEVSEERSKLPEEDGARTENELNLAAMEIEELWVKLNAIGLSNSLRAEKVSLILNGSVMQEILIADGKTHLLAASRHLSSSLGDSFCLLPSKGRASMMTLNGTMIDGGLTLRAAVASRMRNQRLRLIENQGGRPAAQQQKSNLVMNNSSNKSSACVTTTPMASPSDDEPSDVPVELVELKEIISQQKHEIFRLLSTVKSLSSENAKLLTKCEALSTVKDECKSTQQAIEQFKGEYGHKV
uniref:Uncharacterized protein AlNc14C321G10597 n=1 Tax=Albugo laibachii Nc14 TaxID=890382 RepID=F0WWG4_9STRA|nr:conserved hypothetical protein [Albugo laibachii Nc14]|eukprot:CCA25787.1 conserved hypothetical protein [Albugo laibachii Nc14]